MIDGNGLLSASMSVPGIRKENPDLHKAVFQWYWSCGVSISHAWPLQSAPFVKLICTIIVIITHNLGCGNYTCTIISLFWIDLCAGVLKYGVKHVNGSRESCIGKQCMWALSTLFMHFLVGAASPNPFWSTMKSCSCVARLLRNDGALSNGFLLDLNCGLIYNRDKQPIYDEIPTVFPMTKRWCDGKFWGNSLRSAHDCHSDQER